MQILHSGGRHWVTASTIGTQPGHVRMYDSLYSDLPFSTKEQIAAIVCSSGPKITLEYANVQVCLQVQYYRILVSGCSSTCWMSNSFES